MSQQIQSGEISVKKPMVELLLLLPVLAFDAALLAFVVSGLVYGFIHPVSFPVALVIGALTLAVSMAIALWFYWRRFSSRSISVVEDCLVISNGRKELSSTPLTEIRSIDVTKPEVFSALGLLSRLPFEWLTADLAAVVVTPRDVWANAEIFDLLITRKSTAREVHAQLKRLIPELVGNELV